MRLTDVQAAVCPVYREVTPQLITSNGTDMAAEVEPNLSRSGDEVSISEEVHPFHIPIDKQAILEEVVSNIGTSDRQRNEDRPRRSCYLSLAGLYHSTRDACINVQKVDLNKYPEMSAGAMNNVKSIPRSKCVILQLPRC